MSFSFRSHFTAIGILVLCSFFLAGCWSLSDSTTTTTDDTDAKVTIKRGDSCSGECIDVYWDEVYKGRTCGGSGVKFYTTRETHTYEAWNKDKSKHWGPSSKAISGDYTLTLNCS